MPRDALSGSADVPNKRGMHAHITLHVGTIETVIQAKRDLSPCRVASLAVKVNLEASLAIFRVAAVFGFRTLFSLRTLRTLNT